MRCKGEQVKKLKNIRLSPTHARVSTHLVCHRVLFCKGQLPRGGRSAKHLTVRHPQMWHMHCTRLQNNPSCASAISASLSKGSSCNTSTMCTYKGKGSSRHTAHGGDVAPGAPHLLLTVRKAVLLRGSGTAPCANCLLGSDALLSQLKASIAGFQGKAFKSLLPSFLTKCRPKGVGKCFQQFLLGMNHACWG